MIGSLRGILLDRSPRGDVLVEVGAVGYRVVVPTGTSATMGELGSPVFLHVHTHVREDAIILYGFATREERACFEALIGAHGVGPGLALAILSVHSPAGLRRALLTDDADALTLVPGVGKKTAARLLMELKSRLDLPELDSGLVSVGVGPGGGSIDGGSLDGGRSEVRAALAGLGYAADEVRDAVRELPDDGEVSELLRLALRSLASNR
ncbi:MAG TPA: Holliday junction branch migration protein RuvA [Acidimicrobiales bacterium]